MDTAAATSAWADFDTIRTFWAEEMFSTLDISNMYRNNSTQGKGNNNLEKRGQVIIYQKGSAEVQRGLDESRANEWATWVNHRAADVVTKEEADEHIANGAEVLGTQWVDTDQNEHFKLDQKGSPEMINPFQQSMKSEIYVPNDKSRLVARGDQEVADIRNDIPTCGMEMINVVCSAAACYKRALGDGYSENAYSNAENLTRIPILRFPHVGLPDKSISPERHGLKANVPIDGTRAAGRRFWRKLRRVPTDKACLKDNFSLNTFYRYVDADDQLAAVLGTIVDDAIYAIRPDHNWILDAIVAELIFGKLEERSFRSCGREITQDENCNINMTCNQTTPNTNDTNISPNISNTSEGPATKEEVQPCMSVVGSFSWIARVCRADLTYNVGQLQQMGQVAKVSTLKFANKVIKLAHQHRGRGFTFKSGVFDWTTVSLLCVTDAVFFFFSNDIGER
ncbi:hypothetical protein N9L68_07740 [bacterium]|nr:hypothetical protein [bacterium]